MIFQKKQWKITASDYRESEEGIQNPSMGWYHLYPFVLSEDVDWDYLRTTIDDGENLALLEISIVRYRNCEIDMAGLEQLQQIIKFFDDYHKDIILRIVYDMDGKGMEREPSSFSMILKHMQAIGKVVAREPAIYLTQGLFIGSWGEMHSSKYLTMQHILSLYHTWREAVGNDIYIAVRTPVILRWILNDTATDKNIALFNDAIMSNETDMGTYGIKEQEEVGELCPWNVKEEVEYQNRICNEAPNGGEVVGNNYITTGVEVVERLQRMHISYLNSQYDMNTLKSWQEMQYLKENVKSFVDRRLGYRYLVTEARIEKRTEEMTITLCNVGFSKMYEAVKGNVIFEADEQSTSNLSDAVIIEKKIQQNLQIIPGQCQNIVVPLEEIPHGNYKVSIRLQRIKDGREIKIANKSHYWCQLKY